MAQHRDAFVWAHIFANSGSGAAEARAIRLLSLEAERLGRSESFIGIDKQRAIYLCRAAVNLQA